MLPCERARRACQVRVSQFLLSATQHGNTSYPDAYPRARRSQRLSRGGPLVLAVSELTARRRVGAWVRPGGPQGLAEPGDGEAGASPCAFSRICPGARLGTRPSAAREGPYRGSRGLVGRGAGRVQLG